MIRLILALLLTSGFVAGCTPTTAKTTTDTVDNADAMSGTDASGSGDTMDPNDMGDMDMGSAPMPGMDM